VAAGEGMQSLLQLAFRVAPSRKVIMIKQLLALFRKPTALEIAARDLEQAKRDYLFAMQHSEYYAAQAQYNDGLIARLSNYIRESTE